MEGQSFINPVWIIDNTITPRNNRPFSPNIAGDLTQIGNAVAGGPNSALALVMAQERENELARNNQVLTDWDQLEPITFLDRYGQEVYDQMATLAQSRSGLARMDDRQRTPGQWTGDQLNSIATGFVGGLGDLATLGVGMVNDDAGRMASDLTEGFRDVMRDQRSVYSQQNEFLAGFARELDELDNTAAYDADIAEGSSEMEATFGYLGRGLVNGAARLLENGGNLERGISEGIGSLLAGGPASKGIKAGLSQIGRTVIRDNASDIVEQAAMRSARTWGDAAAMPLTIGAMEGGNAYSSTVQQVMSMSLEELAANSERFRELVDGGMDPESARQEVAAEAGTQAAAIAAPAGALAGKLVSRFEAAPFARQTAGQMAGNLLREGVEEGAQGLTGTLGANVGLQVADNTQAPLEGAGDAISEGALLGSLTAGAIQAPAAAGRAVGQVAGAALDAVVGSGQRAVDRVEAAEGVTEERVAEMVQTTTAATPEIETAIAEAVAQKVTAVPLDAEIEIEETESTRDEDNEQTQQTLDDLLLTSFSLEDDDILEMDPRILGQFAEKGLPENKMAAAFELAKIVNNQETAPDLRLSAALQLKTMLDRMNNALENDIPKIVGSMPEDNPALTAIQQQVRTLNDFGSSPAMTSALSVAENPDLKPSTETENAAMAESRPDAVDVPMATRMLLQDAADGVILTLAKRRALRAAIALQKASKTHNVNASTALAVDEAVDEGAQTDPSSEVSQQIATKGGSQANQRSLVQYTSLINQQMRSGNLLGAKKEMRRLANFSMHMMNKMEAWNASLETGKPVEFERIGPNFNELSKGIAKVHKDDPNSLKMGRIIYDEMQAVHALLRSLADIYPEMGLKQTRQVPKLAEGFKGKAQTPPPASSTSAPGKSRFTPEQAATLSVDRIRQYSKVIEERMANGTLQPGDKETLDVLVAEANRILDIDSQGRSEKIIADKVAKLTPEFNQAVFEKIAGLVDGNGRVPVKEFSAEEKVSLRYHFKVRTTKTYGYLPELLFNQAVKFTGKKTPPKVVTPAAPVVAPAEPKKLTPSERVAARFSKLLKFKDADGTEGNMFHRAYRYANKPKSLMENEENVWEKLYALAESQDGFALTKYVDTLNFAPNDKALANIRAMLKTSRALGDVLSRRLKMAISQNEFLQKNIDNGVNVARFRRYRTFAAVEQTDGGLDYNQELLDGVSMAAVHWRMTSGYMAQSMSLDEIVKMTGLEESEALKVKDFFDSGMLKSTAIDSLAKTIKDFWGVVDNPNVGKGITEGIVENFAREALLSMRENAGGKKTASIQGTGDIQLETRTINDKSYTVVRFIDNKQGRINKIMDRIGPESDFVADAVLLNDWERGVTIGEIKHSNPQVQIRNPNSPLTDEQKKAVKELEKIPHYPNVNLHRFISLAGEKVVRLFRNGFDVELDQDGEHSFNNEHMRSVVGKNRTLFTAYQEMERLMRWHLLSPRDSEGNQPPIFWNWGVVKSGRYLMLGSVNPESDKLFREVFSPTWSTLDMSDPFGQDAQRFWKGVAQGLGMKTHRVFGHQTMDKAMADTLDPDGRLYGVVEALAGFLRVPNDKLRPEQTPASLMPKIKEIMGKDATMHAMSSLMAVAEYRNALEGPSNSDAEVKTRLKAFRTSVYMEADGITNGPFMALVRYATGAFTSNWVEMVAKGGLFFGSEPTTMNDYFNNGGESAQTDIYTKVSKGATTRIQDKRSKMTPSVRGHMDALYRLMKAFEVSLTMDSDEPEVSRDGAKNPVTITVYASGVDGMNKKVVAELEKKLYAHLSDLNQRGGKPGTGLRYGRTEYTPEQFEADLAVVTTQGVIREKKNFYITQNEVIEEPIIRNFKTFTFDKDQRDILRNNMFHYFTSSLHESIKETMMGHVESVTKPMQQMTQAQSLIMADVFQREVLATMVAKGLATEGNGVWSNLDGLSENDIRDIWKKILVFAPVIETPSQNFMMADNRRVNDVGTETVTINGKEEKIGIPLSTGTDMLDDALREQKGYFGPGEAGVSAIPLLTIGSGDALSMQVLFARLAQETMRVLSVYDGLNIAAQDIAQISEMMNEAVSVALSENVLESVSDNAQMFLKNNIEAIMENMSQETRIGLLKVARGKPEVEDPGTNEQAIPEIMGMFSKLSGQLESNAREAAIRQEVMRQVPHSIDQMAGGEMPYVNKGSSFGRKAFEGITIKSSFADIEAALNKVRDHVVKEMAEKAKTEATAEDAARDRLSNAIQQKAQQHKTLRDVTGAVVMAPAELVNTIRGKVPRDHWVALQLALKNHTMDDVKVVVGTKDEITAYQMKYHPDTIRQNEVAFKGKYDTVNRVVYLADLNTETIAHELLHAATANKLAVYYSTPNRLTSVDRDAIQKLEALMEEFLEGRMNFLNRKQQMAYNELDARLLELLHSGQKMAALSEFISYTLTQQELVNLSKRTVVTNALAKWVTEALQALKELLWGKVKVPETNIGKSFYQNMRFNVELLTGTNDLMSAEVSTLRDLMLYQSKSFGQDERLAVIRDQLSNAMATMEAHARRMDDRVEGKAKTARERVRSEKDFTKNFRQAEELAENLIANGFKMNMQERTTFNLLVATLFSDLMINRNSVSRMQDVYDHVISNLTFVDFMENPGVNDGSVENERDKAQAKIKFDALNGRLGSQMIREDQSDLMAAFVALSIVHPQMRSILAKMTMPKGKKAELVEGHTRLDVGLEDFGMSVMERLDRAMAGEGNIRQVDAVMDSLVSSMLRNKLDHETYIETESQRAFRKVEGFITEEAAKRAEKLSEAAAQLADRSTNRLVRLAANSVSAVTGLMNRDVAAKNTMSIISQINQGETFKPLREVMVEIVGLTEENKNVFKMINIVRKMVDQIRQTFREELPMLLKAKFTKHVTPESWDAARMVMLKLDLTAVMNVEGRDRALAYLTDGRTRQGRLVELTGQIRTLDADFADMIISKSDQLAEFMHRGVAGNRLLKNAEAISKLVGLVAKDSRKRASVDLVQLESLVDQYVTLKALSLVPSVTMTRVKVLMQENPEGVATLMDTLAGIRNDELRKPASDRARLNRYKGYSKPLYEQGTSLIVAPLRDAPKLILKGYQRAGTYKGSNLDVNRGTLEYFYAPVSGYGHFNQGIIQNTAATFSGVNPETGFSVDQVAGRITGRSVSLINMQRQKDTGGAEALVPVYDENHNVVAYERFMDPAMLSKLNQNTNLPEILGAWRGRQMEEAMAKQVNHESIKRLKKMWDDGAKAERQNEFVDLSKITRDEDPVVFDAFNLIPKHVKEEIYEVYGDRVFMVRRDMVNTAIGARSANVADFWTGQSRFSPETQEKLRNAILGIFGSLGKENKAFTVAVGAQQVLEGIISDAKQMIVIKSIIVPAINLMSNVTHLMTLGVNIRSIITGLARKTSETNDYMRRRRMEVELDTELLAARGRKDEGEVIRLSNRIQAIKDSYRKLSIWPLIEAGEFSSISSGGFTREEIAVSDGRWGSIIETLQDKIPDQLKPFYRYAMLTKDTPIFRAMSLATQYGDFLGKAIAYDHLTQVENRTKEQALEQITEEFVHYNFYAGRVRGALESLGMAWFLTYKLRSIKIAARTLRNNPLRSVMMMSMSPLDSPLEDNLLSKLWDGTFFSTAVGPGMAQSAIDLHPWNNLSQEIF